MWEMTNNYVSYVVQGAKNNYFPFLKKKNLFRSRELVQGVRGLFIQAWGPQFKLEIHTSYVKGVWLALHIYKLGGSRTYNHTTSKSLKLTGQPAWAKGEVSSSMGGPVSWD